MSHNPIPKKVNLTEQEFIDLENEIRRSDLSEKSRDLVIKSLHFMTWLQNSLGHAKVSIKKLQKLFGILPSKRKKKNVDQGNSSVPDEVSSSNQNHIDKDALKSNKDNKIPGRTPAEDYTGAIEVIIKHHELKPCDWCPTGCGGKLHLLKPSVVIRVEGSSFARATVYKIDRLRCSTCGDMQKPLHDLPKEKYSSSLISQLIMNKYYMAMPFYRIEECQKHLGVPMSDTTQWKLVNAAYKKLSVVFGEIEKQAALSKLFYYDDTRVRILSVMKDNVDNPDKKRTDQYTTVVIAESEGKTATLFYSSISHAGENMKKLLEHRPEGSGKFIAMSDAMSLNKIDHEDVIEANFLAHALVKFIDLDQICPYDLSRPINDLTKAFRIDLETKSMTDIQRLEHHKEYSVPILNELLIWLKQQIDERLIEPTSHAGKAVKYCLKHWDKLIKFTVAAGCPVSNNLSERRIKLIIRLRKASMFHKTEHGAKVAATMLSLIQTAIDNGVNPVEYMEHILLLTKDQIVKELDALLPWSFEAIPKVDQAC